MKMWFPVEPEIELITILMVQSESELPLAMADAVCATSAAADIIPRR